MAKIKQWGSSASGLPNYVFKCPGCKSDHVVTAEIHIFNGNFDQPTLQPSVLYVNKPRCHSFVTDGRIQFLTDCDHELSGQTVDLPEL